MSETYDYVVVGAGAAGCVLGARLSEERDASVVVLEAGGTDRLLEVQMPGGFSRLIGTEHDWNYTTSAQPGLGGRRLTWPRGKLLGGSASINAQMWVRGHRADYDEWGADCPGWSFADVEPYFRRAERRHGSNNDGVYGTDGPQWISELRHHNEMTADFLAACAELGLPRLPELNSHDNAGYAPVAVTQRRGRRWSVVDGYLRPARRRVHFNHILDARVQRILFSGKEATGVVYLAADGTVHRLTARREVILCAGAVGSPELLLRSGVGDPDQLAAVGIEPVHALPGVGTNLRDHPSIGVYWNTSEPNSLASAWSTGNVLRYRLLRRGPLTSNVGEAVAFISSGPGLSAPDLELLWAPTARSHRTAGPVHHGVTVDVILLRPDSRGTVTLADADPESPPVIDPGYLTAPADLTRLVAGLRFAERLFDTDALGRRVATPMDPYQGTMDDRAAAEYVRQQLLTLYHPVGTCRMGTDAEAVVDTELRVRGLDGLRVADASVLPLLNRGHTLAPTVMLAERAADLIRSGTSGEARENSAVLR
jgi:choline dehydrogenase